MKNTENQTEDSDNPEHDESNSTIDNEVEVENDSDDDLTLEEQLQQSMAKADENWDKYLRAVAELENVRKRAVRDVEKARKYAVESFAKELLVVIDSFEMAMGSEDIELKEFSDEIEEWVIAEFKKVGLDTAKSILELEKTDLIKRTDLEEETVEEVIRILKEEFDK